MGSKGNTDRALGGLFRDLEAQFLGNPQENTKMSAH
jgi:hypothetical protein